MSIRAVPLRRLVTNVVAKDRPGSRPLINLDVVGRGTGGLVAEAELPSSFAEQNLAADQSDLLYAKLRPYLRKSCVPALPVFASGEFLCLRPSGLCDVRWLKYASLSDMWAEYAVASAYGAKMPRTSWEQVADLALPTPELEKQRRIADFLDDQVSRIDQVEDLRSSQLDKLGERARSAYDRIFDGPERPLKSLLAQHPCYGVLVPRFVDSGGVPFIRVGDLSQDDLLSQDLVQIEAAQSTEYRRTVIRAGDVLLSVVGSTDKALVVTPDLAGCNVARAVARIVPGVVPPKVLIGWARTSRYAYFAKVATGSDTAQPTLNMGDLKNFGVGLPVGVSLADLVARVSQVESTHASLRSELQSSIGLMQERKRALITAAVTGEFDVTTARGRGVA